MLAASASLNGDIELYTSELSQVEVAFAKTEQDHKALDPEIEKQIDSLWADRNAVKLVEYYSLIGKEARQFIRLAVSKGWSLKPLDAVHLATAKQRQCGEFHTYDERLLRLSNEIGFPIVNPHIQQPRLHL